MIGSVRRSWPGDGGRYEKSLREGERATYGRGDLRNQFLAAGLIDELRLHVVPLTLGASAAVAVLFKNGAAVRP
jgi:dihydrofolate reductase